MIFSGRWKRTHTWLVGVGLVLVVIVVVLGMSRQGSNTVARRALANLVAAEQFHTEAEIKLSLPKRLRGAERPFTEVLGQLSGDVRYSDSGVPELAGTLYAEAKGRGTIFFADGDVRLLENGVLFRLDNLPVFLNRSGSLVDRWTEVETPLLTTNNPADVAEAFELVFSSLVRSGDEQVDGERLVRFTGSLSEEEEQALADVLRQKVSGNRSLHVLSRLLAANVVKTLEVWIAPSREEVRRVRIHFVRPLSDGREFDFATVSLMFSDYNKDVVIDRPEKQLVVEPRVFAKLFGSGEVEDVEP